MVERHRLDAEVGRQAAHRNGAVSVWGLWLPALHPFARYGVTVFGLSEFAMIFWLLIVGVKSWPESAGGEARGVG